MTTTLPAPSVTDHARTDIAHALHLVDALGLEMHTITYYGSSWDREYHGLDGDVRVHVRASAAELDAIAERGGWRPQGQIGSNFYSRDTLVELHGRRVKVELIGDRPTAS